MANFELDLTSHQLYEFIAVVSTKLLYHMYGRRFILFFSRPRLLFMRRKKSKTARNTTLEDPIKPRPQPYPMELVRKMSDFFVVENLVDRIKTHNIRHSPISIIYPR